MKSFPRKIIIASLVIPFLTVVFFCCCLGSLAYGNIFLAGFHQNTQATDSPQHCHANSQAHDKKCGCDQFLSISVNKVSEFTKSDLAAGKFFFPDALLNGSSPSYLFLAYRYHSPSELALSSVPLYLKNAVLRL